MRREQRGGYFKNCKVAILIETNKKGKVAILNEMEGVIYLTTDKFI